MQGRWTKALRHLEIGDLAAITTASNLAVFISSITDLVNLEHLHIGFRTCHYVRLGTLTGSEYRIHFPNLVSLSLTYHPNEVSGMYPFFIQQLFAPKLKNVTATSHPGWIPFTPLDIEQLEISFLNEPGRATIEESEVVTFFTRIPLVRTLTINDPLYSPEFSGSTADSILGVLMDHKGLCPNLLQVKVVGDNGYGRVIHNFVEERSKFVCMS